MTVKTSSYKQRNVCARGILEDRGPFLLVPPCKERNMAKRMGQPKRESKIHFYQAVPDTTGRRMAPAVGVPVLLKGHRGTCPAGRPSTHCFTVAATQNDHRGPASKQHTILPRYLSLWDMSGRRPFIASLHVEASFRSRSVEGFNVTGSLSLIDLACKRQTRCRHRRLTTKVTSYQPSCSQPTSMFDVQHSERSRSREDARQDLHLQCFQKVYFSRGKKRSANHFSNSNSIIVCANDKRCKLRKTASGEESS